MTHPSARADRRLIRANAPQPSLRARGAHGAAGDAGCASGAPVNLAFVLDRSGSMSGAKLDLAKRAVEEALGRLDARDRFSIVVYDDVVDVVVESTPASPEARRNAIDRLADDRRARQHEPRRRLVPRLRAGRGAPRGGRASTAPAADRRPRQRRHDRPGELAHHAAELRARGVSTTTFGVGRRLRRGPPAGDGRRRWRPLLLHRRRGADPRPHRERGRRDPGGRGPRRRAGGPGGRGRRGRGHQPAAVAAARGTRRSSSLGDLVADQVARRRPAADLPVRPARSRDRGHRRPHGSRRRLRGGRGAARHGCPGPMPTTGRTTRRRGTPTSTGPSRGSSPRAPARRPASATAPATTSMPAGSWTRRPVGSAATPAGPRAPSAGQRARGRRVRLRAADGQAGTEAATFRQRQRGSEPGRPGKIDPGATLKVRYRATLSLAPRGATYPERLRVLAR